MEFTEKPEPVHYQKGEPLEELETIDQCGTIVGLPEKFKVWCFQLELLPDPLAHHHVMLSQVEAIESHDQGPCSCYTAKHRYLYC